MKRLRVALAGAGMASRHHLIAWSRCDSARIVALADPDVLRSRTRAREFGIADTFDDAAVMLDAVCPDALDIAAGHEAHAPLCALAADRGVAILCQKPLAPTLDAARSIVDHVGDRVRIMVHENFRYRPYYRQAKAWIDAGAIGTVRQLVLSARGSGLVPGPDGTRPALVRQPMLANVERLMIGEVLIHHLDVACWLAGPLALDDARLRYDVDAVQGESAAAMLLHGADERTVIVEGDIAVPAAASRVDDRLDLIGSQGAIRLEDSVVTLFRPAEVPTVLHYDRDEAYQASYDAAIAHFAAAVASGQPFETPPDVHLRVLALMEAAYAAAGANGSLRVVQAVAGNGPRT